MRTDSGPVRIDFKVVNANIEPVVEELIEVDEESLSNEPTNNSEKFWDIYLSADEIF